MEPINVKSLITTDVETKSAEAATELLKQSGWDIINEMAKAVADGINSTALVVLPVSVNLEKYKALMTDPEGFENKFNTLRNDVQALTKAMLILHNQHDGKTGGAEGMDLGVLQALSMGYTKLQGHIESAVQPLLLNLVDELEAVGITELTVEGVENAA